MTGCARLALLDANPVVDGTGPLPAVAEARFKARIRGLNFR